MNPSLFFDNFSLLADSPNGVRKLREMILQLAVMGKLVPQDPNDEPASVLLEKIRNDKKKLVREGVLKKNSTQLEVQEEEISYEIPVNWYWTRLENIGIINPRNNAPDDLDVSFVPMTLISEKYGEGVESEIRPWKDIKKGYTHFAENDVVMAKITPCYQNGKSAVMKDLINGIGAGTTELHVFRSMIECVFPAYVLIYLKTPQFIEKGITKMTGSAGQKRVPNDYFSKNPFPLPPPEEQKRIVAKVDQLMTLCDELEALHQHRNENRIHLNNAAINKLLDASSVNEFNELWQLIYNNFDLLYDNLDNVAKLRQTILQLAVMGKLVPQDPNDEPASVLLGKIRDEKERLVKEGKIVKTKSFNSLDITEVPFELPLGWSWTRMGDITQKLGAGSTPKGGKSIYLSEGVKFIRSQNVWNNGLSLENVAMIPRTIHEKMSGTYVEQGDILLNITGASIGRSSVVLDDFDEGNVSQHVAIIRLVDKTIRGFIHVGIVSPFIQNQIMEAQVGISREGLSMNRLRDFMLPLPPLEEQKRIVAKVDQLMALCDELEMRIKMAQEDGEKITSAIVSNLTAI